MIKYIGSKRLILPRIVEAATSLPGVRSAVDLFSGTARVGHALKGAGLFVVANDHNAYAHALGRCYVRADGRKLRGEAEALIAEMSREPPRAGYFTETFCVRSRFFQPRNGERIDAMREFIARRSLDPDLEAVLLVSLMEAADRVDSTTGLQMAYLKAWAPRAHKPIEPRLPALLDGPGEAWQKDAKDAARDADVDLAYLDPPYNQHSYRGNYHIWETLVRWDSPPVYGVACKREDCRTYRNPFNSRKTIEGALSDVVSSVRARYLLLSFNNEGFLSRKQLLAMLEPRGKVSVMELDFKRYVGAQIGIYNPRGEKVGKVGHLRNKEYLFLVDTR